MGGSAVNNATLRAALVRSGALTPARSVVVITQIAAVVDVAAASEAVRADVIDPTNIVLAADDVAYLADTDGAGNEAGTSIEGLAYLAPERLTHNAPVSAATDVYALACVLFECLTGVPPWPPGSDLSEVIAARQAGAVPRPSQHLPSIPVGFDGVIARGLAVDPAQRYASAGELAVAARAALGGPVAATATADAEPAPVVSAVGGATRAPRAPIPAVVPEAAGAASSRSGKRRRRVRIAVLVTTVTAIVAVAAAAAAVVVIRHQRSSTSTSAAPAPANPWTELSFPGLREPTGLAVDRAGNVYVTDMADKNWVFKLVADATTATRLPAFDTPTQWGAQSGQAVAADRFGDIYIVGFDNSDSGDIAGHGRVWKLAVGANTPTELPVKLGIDEPASVAADDAGNIYVAGTAWPDRDGGALWKVDSNHDTLAALALPSSTLVPAAVAVDGKGNIYITDHDDTNSYQSWKIWKLSPGASDPTILPGLAAPTGVAVDAAGNVYTASFTHQRVCQLAAGADWPRVVPTMKLNDVEHVAVDSGGNLYFTDTDYEKRQARVLKVSAGYQTQVPVDERGQPQSC